MLNDNVIQPHQVDEGKRKADAYLKALGLNDEQINHLRVRCKKDLFFLCYSILGYDKLSPNLHGALCVWLQSTEGEQFRIILLPRSHYKSTISTIGDSIQTVLPDILGDSIYPRNLGTNGRLLICHEKHEAATRFLFSIQQHFTLNPALTALFPECVPNPRRHKINKNELELPRTNIWSEPTIDTMGVGGKNQGRHYNKIKADDIYGAEARDSKAERDSTILWFDNLQSYFITPKTDQLDIAGTRWAFDDIYQHSFNVYGSKLKKFIRGAIDKESGLPTFPEQFSLESFEILKRNPKVWNAQYANDPREGAAAFKPEWLRYYNRAGRNIILFNGLESKEIEFESLDRIVFIDPAVTGKSGITVTGTSPDHEIIVLDAIKGEFKTEELLDLMFRLMIKWRARVLAIEEVLFSALYEPLIRREMQLRGYRFKVEMVKVGKVEKENRVYGLANYFSAGQIYLHQDQGDLLTEFHQFGATDDYHMLDSLSMGPKLWRAGINRRLIDSYRQAELTIQGINPITGYSRIR